MDKNYTLAAIAASLLISACSGGSDSPEAVGEPSDSPGQETVQKPSDSPDPETVQTPSDSPDPETVQKPSDNPDPETVQKPIEALPTYSISGRVIDGYISGATVWVDFDNDGLKDADEPSAESGHAGAYSLELTEIQIQCAQFATLYVDVPVGAIDEDLGEVTEAYQMVRPPELDVITDETLLHISPLTTALWQEIEKRLNGSTFSDCNSLLVEQDKRQEMQQLIKETIYHTVSFYNISENEIFEDFIASGNEESKDFAQKFVKGLQKSLSYRAEVEKQYPTATEIRVVHYFGTHLHYSDKESHWFRKIHVSDGNHYYSRDDLMSDTLDDIVKPIYYRDAIDTAWGKGKLTLTKDVIYRGEDGYECSFTESVSVIDSGVTYQLENSRPNIQLIASVEDCINADFANGVPDRTFYISYDESGKSYLADLRQTDNSVTVLPHWVDFEGQSDEFDFAELITELEVTGYRYGEEILIPTNYWYKREEWSEGDIYYAITYRYTGEWEKHTRFKDGTHTDECSYDEGKTWEMCAD